MWFVCPYWLATWHGRCIARRQYDTLCDRNEPVNRHKAPGTRSFCACGGSASGSPKFGTPEGPWVLGASLRKQVYTTYPLCETLSE